MKPELNQRQQQILDYLQEHDGATAREVMAACGLSTTHKAIETLTGLYARRLVGRQAGLYHRQPTRWYVETVVAR